jgi:lysophospholipase L1-like esterase
VGTTFGVEDGAPANSWPQEWFAGHEGWTSSDAVFSDNLNAALGTSPDVLILDFGSNDISPAGIPLSQTKENLTQIIQAFAAQNPSIIIFIAKPTPFAVDPSSSKADQKLQKKEQSQLVGIVSSIAQAERKAGVRVYGVNLFAGFNVKKDTIDGSHPNVKGEQMIAAKYFKNFKKYVKKS